MDAITPNQIEQFGHFLVERDHLKAGDLARAWKAYEASDAPLHIVVERLGLAKETTLLEALATFLDLPLITRRDFPSVPICEDQLSPEFLKKRAVFPLKELENSIVIACVDPMNAQLIQALEFHLERPIELALASARDIEWAITTIYANPSDDTPPNEAPSNADIETLKSLATEQPVIRFVNRLLEEAVSRRASDIHLEPEETGLHVRFRVDGVLLIGERPPLSMAAAITSRIKIMAKLNIAERRLPQDGRIRTNIRGSEIDLRVSTTPTLHGESVVLRVLDKSAVTLDFSTLGFNDHARERYLELLNCANGVILVTGPTGSGKTTTLYTSLKFLNDGRRKIFSVEDPVEYQLAGVNQIPVQPKIGLDFSRALRSILRQDPDIIMIGEIRDLETAEIAIQASLTGHLVLATLHTNSAAATITRLLDMGVEDYLLASTIAGVAAQRLVRTVCDKCAMPDDKSLAVIAELSPETIKRFANPEPRRGTGCEKCQSTGFKGRASIIEVMPATPDIRRLVVKRASDREIQRLACNEGMRTMLEAGFDKVLAGHTTLDELLRVAKMN